jgi:F0F1-type ATP synthase assembly protein I
MIRRARVVGIAVGSLVIAYLAVGLVAGIFLGPAVRNSPLVGVVIVVLGGLVFADIVRRDRLRASANGSPSA